MIKKYIRVYLLLLQLNFSALFSYRANVINSVVATVGWGIISVGSMYLLTFRTTQVFSWTRNELLMATGLYSVLIGVFHMFFSRNFERFSRIIHRGELDSILVKPLDPQFLISMWIFRYTNIARVFLGILFVWYMIGQMHIVLSIGQLLLFLCFFCSSLMILYGFWLGISTITIWFTNLSNLIDFLYTTSNLGRYPSEMFSSTGNIFLYIFIPLTFISTVPAKVLFHHLTLNQGIIALACGVGFYGISYLFFHYALRFYTSASG